MKLGEVLGEARELGFLGPGPVEAQVAHAEGFARALTVSPIRVMDLGSGGGIPGLVLAQRWPGAMITLLDSSRRRTAFLAAGVSRLGLEGRVEVITGRAEVVGRDERFRGCFDTVVARSFGPPAVVAECGAPFLAQGGVLLVSEPPEDSQARWQRAGLSELGLEDEGLAIENPRIRRLRQGWLCPERFSRRSGIPSKRPLW